MSRRRRIALSLVGLFIALLGWGLFAPSSASAACPPGVSNGTDEPIPQMPGTGVMGWIESPPNPLPPDADPFQKGSGTTIQEQYGYAGLRWNTFDLGCGGDLADPISAGVNAMANIAMMTPVVLAALTGALLRWAFVPDFLTAFDPMVSETVAGLKDSVFLVWLPLPGIVLGSIILFKSHRSQLSDTASAVAGVGAVLFAACLIFNQPLLFGHTADKVVTSANSALVGALNGKVGANQSQIRGTASEMEANLHRSVLYNSWLTGELGRGHDDTATKYGPDLWKSQTMTWREAAEYQADPTGKGADIISAKNQLWDDTTQKIKDEDPDAYENLTGHHSDTRLAAAWMAFAGVMCAIPFLILAASLVLLALMIVRFAMMFFPVVALVGMIPQTRHAVTDIGRACFAACLNCVIFTFGSALLVRAFSYITDPANGLNMLLQLVIMLISSVIFWVVLRPFRRLTQMVGRRNHFADAAGGVSHETRRGGRFLWGVAKTAGSAALGFRIGRAMSEDERGDRTEVTEETTTTRVETSALGTPPPQPPRPKDPAKPQPELPSPVYDPDDVHQPESSNPVPLQRSDSDARVPEQDADGQEYYRISDDSIPFEGSGGGSERFDPGAVGPSSAPALPAGPTGGGE